MMSPFKIAMFPALLALMLASPARALAETPLDSAARGENESFAHALQRNINAHPSIAESGRVFDEVYLADAAGMARAINSVQPWQGGSRHTVEAAFDLWKDRYLPWQITDTTQYVRRIPWRYPQDGCMLRAALLNLQIATQFHQPRLQRVFVLGSLSATAPDAPEGHATWYYHVAPVTKIDGKALVLDATLSPKKPMPLNDWLDAVVSAKPDPAQSRQELTIAVCDAAAYNPFSLCEGEDPSVETGRLREDTPRYLNHEWNNMIDLGIDPAQALLDSPKHPAAAP